MTVKPGDLVEIWGARRYFVEVVSYGRKWVRHRPAARPNSNCKRTQRDVFDEMIVRKEGIQ